MGATSVTGVSGPGDSYGKYKPELHCGGCACGCGSNCEPEAVEQPRTTCYLTYKSGGTIISRSGSAAISVKGC